MSDDSQPIPGTLEKPATWHETRPGDRWDRSDGCCVKIDHSVECNSSRPWLPNYRGWKAFGNRGEFDALCFRRCNTRMQIPRKFKSAEAAMLAVDTEFPPDGASQPTLL